MFCSSYSDELPKLTLSDNVSNIVLGLLVAVAVWVEGIDSMHKNYPDYKGEDLFGEDEEKKEKDEKENISR